jgi:hypothetical protein
VPRLWPANGTWGDKTYSASTLEEWYYLFRNQGFAALKREPRKDRGTRKALGPEASQAIVELRQQYPQLQVKVLIRQLVEKGTLQPGTFSLPSVYRLLAAHQLDARSIKRNPPATGGPTKAFECARGQRAVDDRSNVWPHTQIGRRQSSPDPSLWFPGRLFTAGSACAILRVRKALLVPGLLPSGTGSARLPR